MNRPLLPRPDNKEISFSPETQYRDLNLAQSVFYSIIVLQWLMRLTNNILTHEF